MEFLPNLILHFCNVNPVVLSAGFYTILKINLTFCKSCISNEDYNLIRINQGYNQLAFSSIRDQK